MDTVCERLMIILLKGAENVQNEIVDGFASGRLGDRFGWLQR